MFPGLRAPVAEWKEVNRSQRAGKAWRLHSVLWKTAKGYTEMSDGKHFLSLKNLCKGNGQKGTRVEASQMAVSSQPSEW